eukprot:364588-Chlamydomonas_euryale.AAC.22
MPRDTKVGYHPMLAERLVLKMLQGGYLDRQLQCTVTRVEKQQTFGKSRVDFVLHDNQGVNRAEFKTERLE